MSDHQIADHSYEMDRLQRANQALTEIAAELRQRVQDQDGTVREIMRNVATIMLEMDDIRHVLVGTDGGSVPLDMSTKAVAERRMYDLMRARMNEEKFKQQVIDTAKRASDAEEKRDIGRETTT